MSDQVGEGHFRLLRIFGKNVLQKNVSDKERRTMWELACRSAKLAIVPHDDVVEKWRLFVAGESKDSSIAINGDIDPQFVTLGVTYKSKLVAGHTSTTQALLRRLLQIWRRAFDSDEAFLEAVEAVTRASIGPQTKKRRRP